MEDLWQDERSRYGKDADRDVGDKAAVFSTLFSTVAFLVWFHPWLFLSDVKTAGLPVVLLCRVAGASHLYLFENLF